jgi:hypothetical protein
MESPDPDADFPAPACRRRPRRSRLLASRLHPAERVAEATARIEEALDARLDLVALARANPSWPGEAWAAVAAKLAWGVAGDPAPPPRQAPPAPRAPGQRPRRRGRPAASPAPPPLPAPGDGAGHRPRRSDGAPRPRPVDVGPALPEPPAGLGRPPPLPHPPRAADRRLRRHHGGPGPPPGGGRPPLRLQGDLGRRGGVLGADGAARLAGAGDARRRRGAAPLG